VLVCVTCFSFTPSSSFTGGPSDSTSLFIALGSTWDVETARAYINALAAGGACANMLIRLFTDGLYTKSTRAHTHRELIRDWL